MSDNAAYDISEELASVEKLDEVQAKLDERRKKKASGSDKQQASPSKSVISSDEKEAEREAQRKKRELEKTKLKKEQEELARKAREEELASSPWITCRHKVNAKRVELLDKLFYRMKADDQFSGTKQEFYDEGLALLEQKHHSNLQWQKQ